MDSSRGVKTLNEESMLIIFFSVIVICKYECQVRTLLQEIMIWMLWLEI